MPQGLRRGPELDLTDRTYDGVEKAGVLSGGLGQLVDGQKGQDNFRLDLAGHGKGEARGIQFCFPIYIYIAAALGTLGNMLHWDSISISSCNVTCVEFDGPHAKVTSYGNIKCHH